jgi:hypothetical protein
MFSLILSQALLMSKLSSKLSKAANLFEISIWYFSLTSTKLSFFRSTHWMGGWMGPRAVLDAVVKRKIPSPRQESNPKTPIVQTVAQRYTDCKPSLFIY